MALLVLALGVALQFAIDVEQGMMVGALAVLAYVLIELLFSFNSAGWSRNSHTNRLR